MSPVLALAALALALGMAGGGKKRKPSTTYEFPEEPVTPGDGDDDAPLEPDVLPPKETPQWPQMAKPSPIAVGDPHDPDIAALLRDMEDEFVSWGVDLNYVTPEEVTRMPKAPGQPVAIPPREFWPRMAQTLKEMFMPLREAMGIPLQVRGYRPADYNEAVGGAPGSRHQWFEAIDVHIPKGGTAADKRKLAKLAAQMFVDRGDELQVGFGVYGTTAPSIHFDTGYDKRTWEDAQYWLNQIGYAGAGYAGVVDIRTHLMVAQAQRKKARRRRLAA